MLLYHGTNEARGGWFDLTHRAAVSKAASEAGHTLIEVAQAKLDQIDPDVTANGKTYHLGQASNCHVFPVIGLAVYAMRPQRITDPSLDRDDDLQVRIPAGGVSMFGSAKTNTLVDARKMVGSGLEGA